MATSATTTANAAASASGWTTVTATASPLSGNATVNATGFSAINQTFGSVAVTTQGAISNVTVLESFVGTVNAILQSASVFSVGWMLVPSSQNVLSIQFEDRHMIINSENRILPIPMDDRTLTVDNENRILEIPDEDRTIIVRAK
jgi:hypothetical protein